MKKPILLLDIDGVLAPWPTKLGFDADTHWHHEGMGVHMRRDLKDLVKKLDVVAELQWGTAWQREANVHMLEHIGLTAPIPYIEFSDYEGIKGVTNEEKEDGVYHIFSGPDAPETWKLPWIERFCDKNADRAIAWLDDEILPDAQAYAEAREAPTLFIKTDGTIGLTEDHIEEIEEWVAGLDKV
jgi:hypothetical protein